MIKKIYKSWFGENKENKDMDFLPSKWKLKRTINTLEMENEVLKQTIKDELYKEFMEKLGEPMEMKRLKTENRKLREKVKMLKEEIKNG